MVQPLNLIPLTDLDPQKPLLVYVPGMDGSGVLIQPQLQSLKAHFEVWGVEIDPQDDRCSWDNLIEALQHRLQKLNPHRRCLYLCGESFGGCLALQTLRHDPTLSDRLILVNCASAFQHQFLLRFSVPLIHWFAPILYFPASVVLLQFLADWQRVPEQQQQDLLYWIQAVKPQTAAWRLSLLDRINLDDWDFGHLQQPALIIAAGSDRLLASVEESDRLLRKLPNAQRIILPESGHTCLLESEVNLAQLLRESQFLEPPIRRSQQSPTPSVSPGRLKVAVH